MSRNVEYADIKRMHKISMPVAGSDSLREKFTDYDGSKDLYMTFRHEFESRHLQSWLKIAKISYFFVILILPITDFQSLF